jgi:putative transposase
VTLSGRRVPIIRPRMRAVDGSGELPLPSYELFSSTEMPGRVAMGKMLAGISTRGWQAGLEPVGTEIEQQATSTSKPAISRRFVKATEAALAELMSRRLDGLDLVALMLDGVHFGEHVCVVALGIGIDGTKYHWPWRATPRTPRWSPICWSGCLVCTRRETQAGR